MKKVSLSIILAALIIALPLAVVAFCFANHCANENAQLMAAMNQSGNDAESVILSLGVILMGAAVWIDMVAMVSVSMELNKIWNRKEPS